MYQSTKSWMNLVSFLNWARPSRSLKPNVREPSATSAWARVKASANLAPSSTEAPGARLFTDSPNRNSVAESIVYQKKSSWRSTVEPSRGIAFSKCWIWGSNMSKLRIWVLMKFGLRRSRKCCQAAPLEVKMPWPSKGVKLRFRLSGKFQLLNLVASIVFMFSGSVVW